KPPRTYRTGIAFVVSFADASTVVIARTSVARTLLQPFSSTDREHAAHRCAGRGTRCDVIAARLRERDQGLLGHFGCEAFASRVEDAAGIQQGDSNPGLSVLPV